MAVKIVYCTEVPLLRDALYSINVYLDIHYFHFVADIHGVLF